MRVAPLKPSRRLALGKRRQERFLIVKQHQYGPRPDGSVIDPLCERLDLLCSQAIFGRHLQIRIVKTNGLHQQAPGGIARHNRRARFAAFERSLQRVQPQSAFLLVGSMTRQTFRLQQRLDNPHKPIGPL